MAYAYALALLRPCTQPQLCCSRIYYLHNFEGVSFSIIFVVTKGQTVIVPVVGILFTLEVEVTQLLSRLAY
jgi:hypothetical protein